MSEKKNVYRRYALAFATFSVAISIGFLMQTNKVNSAARAGDEPSRNQNVQASLVKPEGIVASGKKTGALPSLPGEYFHKTDLPQKPLVMLVSKDIPVGVLPQEESAPVLGCDASFEAEPAAGAMVRLTLSAPCLSGEQVTFHHEALRFTETVGADGSLQVEMPAFAEQAVFAVTFANGDGKVVRTEVGSVPFYDRAAVVWRGEAGLQLHALEFGAGYGQGGHVWQGAMRDVTSAAGGQGGFLTSLGQKGPLGGWRAEVYTFPTLTAKRGGDVALSIEAEVTQANCDQDIQAKSLQISAGETPVVREIQLSIPNCEAEGEFLVLKNLLEDLKIAQNQ